ncbi:hypothetical protein [Microbacterium sp. KR10-403]|uniref:hypothetical protein n=1 Tax=Microbacterium sp. KR10-403 TaxID=3158581 RepID=UPI0032E3F345
MNSLCRFDFLWCTVAVVTHLEKSDGPLFFPSCATLNQSRSIPIVDQLVRSEQTRRALLPDASAESWKAALIRVEAVAVTQSQTQNHVTWWSSDGFDEYVEERLRDTSLPK